MGTESETRQFDGSVLVPGDAEYDRARTVWNVMVDKRPRQIVRCASVRDVVAAVRQARELGLEIGIRCGGHSVSGQAVPEDGLMIDLTPLGGVTVDAQRRRAVVQGGALLGALDRASQETGLATTAGNVSHTGVGGLTLGGGMGWLARQHGLSCDNVVSFEVVTADGDVVRASESEHPELYWGLRGGGGNFGVVTEFEFQLHQVGTEALSVELDFPPDQAAAVLRGWRDLNASAPRRATFTAFIGNDGVTVGYVWIGDADSGRQLVPSIQALGRSTEERVVALSYVDLQTRDDDTIASPALRRYWKGHYFRELTDVAVDALLDRGDPDSAPNVSLQAHGGAIADVPDADTAFSHRDTAFEFVAASRWSDPAEDQVRMDSARTYAASLNTFASGVYVNTLTDEGSAGVDRAFPAHKRARLTAVKDTYDPDNVFHLNHNIRPSRNGAVL